MSRTKALSVLLVSITAIIMTTENTIPATAQVSPAAVKTASAATPDTFVLSQGTNTLRAMLVSAPPVYAPGGPVCFMEEWTGDEALLAEAEQTAAERGAVLVRVICAHGDSDRARLLILHGYSVASEWYTASLPLAEAPVLAGIRPLEAADVPRVLELGEQKRREYQAYSPVFWRVSPLPHQTFAPYMQAQITDTGNIALAHEQNGRIDGFVLVNARGNIDDYTVAAPGLWPTVGASLLHIAGNAASKGGIESLTIVCGAGDTPKRKMLASQGLILATDWYIKPVSPEKK